MSRIGDWFRREKREISDRWNARTGTTRWERVKDYARRETDREKGVMQDRKVRTQAQLGRAAVSPAGQYVARNGYKIAGATAAAATVGYLAWNFFHPDGGEAALDLETARMQAEALQAQMFGTLRGIADAYQTIEGAENQIGNIQTTLQEVGNAVTGDNRWNMIVEAYQRVHGVIPSDAVVKGLESAVADADNVLRVGDLTQLNPDMGYPAGEYMREVAGEAGRNLNPHRLMPGEQVDLTAVAQSKLDALHGVIEGAVDRIGALKDQGLAHARELYGSVKPEIAELTEEVADRDAAHGLGNKIAYAVAAVGAGVAAATAYARRRLGGDDGPEDSYRGGPATGDGEGTGSGPRELPASGSRTGASASIDDSVAGSGPSEPDIRLVQGSSVPENAYQAFHQDDAVYDAYMASKQDNVAGHAANRERAEGKAARMDRLYQMAFDGEGNARMSAEDAAARLGVSTSTVHAYRRDLQTTMGEDLGRFGDATARTIESYVADTSAEPARTAGADVVPIRPGIVPDSIAM